MSITEKTTITIDGYLIGYQRYLSGDSTLTKEEADFFNGAEALVIKAKDQAIKYFGPLGIITGIASVNLMFYAKTLSIVVFGSSAFLFIPLSLGAVGVLITIDLYTIRNACRRIGRIFDEMNAEQKKQQELKKKEDEELKLKEKEELKKKEEDGLKLEEHKEIKTKSNKKEDKKSKPGFFNLLTGVSNAVIGASSAVINVSNVIKNGADAVVSAALVNTMIGIFTKSLMINTPVRFTRYAEFEEVRESMNQLYILPNFFQNEIIIEKEEVVEVK